MKFVFAIILSSIAFFGRAQEPADNRDTTIPFIQSPPLVIDSTTPALLPAAADTAELLDYVIVRGYENYRRLIDVPAPVSVITKADLNRFNNLSLVPALNTAPGVRMEERSPGSYRLNIRGSSLRSP